MEVMVWLICGVFSAVIASGKGRSGFGWLQLSEVCAPRSYTRSIRPSHLPPIIVIVPEYAFDTEYP